MMVFPRISVCPSTRALSSTPEDPFLGNFTHLKIYTIAQISREQSETKSQICDYTSRLATTAAGNLRDELNSMFNDHLTYPVPA